MIFHETPLAGAYVIEPELIEDERGYNARMWCRDEFERMGLVTDWVQANILYNRHRGTLRGMHWQEPPAGEDKLFRVIRGAVHDVIIDLRDGSPTYGEWASFRLSAAVPQLLYVPACFAQGFQTLEDDTELIYQASAPHTPELGRGLRWDDPAFELEWPLAVEVISEKDRTWPDFMRTEPIGGQA
jgi:dTDP-4-dehydrorhamnose 3,5-epimerase